jgi:hypothetical protein
MAGLYSFQILDKTYTNITINDLDKIKEISAQDKFDIIMGRWNPIKTFIDNKGNSRTVDFNDKSNLPRLIRQFKLKQGKRDYSNPSSYDNVKSISSGNNITNGTKVLLDLEIRIAIDFGSGDPEWRTGPSGLYEGPYNDIAIRKRIVNLINDYSDGNFGYVSLDANGNFILNDFIIEIQYNVIGASSTSNIIPGNLPVKSSNNFIYPVPGIKCIINKEGYDCINSFLLEVKEKIIKKRDIINKQDVLKKINDQLELKLEYNRTQVYELCEMIGLKCNIYYINGNLEYVSKGNITLKDYSNILLTCEHIYLVNKDWYKTLHPNYTKKSVKKFINEYMSTDIDDKHKCSILKFIDNLDDIKKECDKFIIDYKLPCNVILDESDNIVQFQIYEEFCNAKNKILWRPVIYIYNPEFKLAYKILKDYNLVNKMTLLTSARSASNLVILKNIPRSYLPDITSYPKNGTLYSNNVDEYNDDYNNACDDAEAKDEFNKKYAVIDANKFYSSALSIIYDVPYCDSSKHIISKDQDFYIIKDGDKIQYKEHYWYLIKLERSTILLDNNGLYSGQYLNYCLEHGENQFEVLECLESEAIPTDFFGTFVIYLKDLLGNNKFKDTINKLIGTMGSLSIKYKKKTFNSFKLSRECSELDNERLSKIEYENDIVATYNMEEYDIPMFDLNVLLNKKIKEVAQISFYEILKDLNVRDENIVHIRVDGIVIKIDDEINMEKLNEIQNNSIDELGLFKFADHKIINKPYSNTEKSNINVTTILNNKNIQSDKLNSILHQGYAGCGKSYHIINKEIPRLTNLGLSYIVLTPTHKTELIYKKNNIRCDVIQSVQHKKEYIDTKVADVIIIDEYGMVDKKSWKYIQYLQSKFRIVIKAYGDCNQLLPVDEENPGFDFINSNLCKIIFNDNIEKINSNYRNNFTKEYYNTLINGDEDYIKQEVKRHSVPFEQAETILCYRHNTVDEYNKKYMDHHNISLKTPGCKVICRSNKCFKKYGIANQDILEISLINDKTITLITEDGLTYEVKKRDIINNLESKKKLFRPAYALTINSFQGDECSSYHFPEEDNKFLSNRMVYTIISRLKEDKINK